MNILKSKEMCFKGIIRNMNLRKTISKKKEEKQIRTKPQKNKSEQNPKNRELPFKYHSLRFCNQNFSL